MQYSKTNAKHNAINNAREISPTQVGDVSKASCMQNHGRTYKQNALHIMLHLRLNLMANYLCWAMKQIVNVLRHRGRNVSLVSEPSRDTVSSQRIMRGRVQHRLVFKSHNIDINNVCKIYHIFKYGD